MNQYINAFKNYANFKGRASRKEYWMFILFHLIFSILFISLDAALGTAKSQSETGIFYGLYSFFTLLPSLALGVRRLHDVGKSGWMAFIAFIPLLGVIWLLVLLIKEGNKGENQYGLDPKE
jgi:uncharacterized membrane protein YhaH (DUF805 family)